jgi:hypothetical protein
MEIYSHVSTAEQREAVEFLQRALTESHACATCGALPLSAFPNISTSEAFERLSSEEKANALRRYACGPHEPIWPAKP